MIDHRDNTEPVTFTKEDLELFLRKSSNGLARVSIQPIRQIAGYIWEHLSGKIDQHSLQNLSDFYITKYPSHSARHKCFIYTRLFLMHLYKSRMDTRILSYHSLFEEPKNKKAQKVLTTRVIVDEDINSLISAIRSDNTLPEFKRENYKALILFLAHSGQRVVTASRLRREQFIEALSSDPPILTVKADQDKNRLEHLVPLHPSIIPYLERLIEDDTRGTDMLFDYVGLQRWLKLHPITMKHTKGKIELKDFRKYFEQKSDEIGFIDANKNFIMSHGVSSVNWQSYKQFLPENVYNVYIKYWKDVHFS